MKRNLLRFVPNPKLPNRLKVKGLIWLFVQNTIFVQFFIPSGIRVAILRLFGARIGKSVFIRRGVRVHFPWNLIIGNQCWIGEEVWFINHAPIELGNDVCVSQAAMLCSSGHDYASATLDYKHKSIRIHHGAWICLRAVVLAGSEVGINSVVSAGETLAGKLPDSHIYIRGEGRFIEKLR